MRDLSFSEVAFVMAVLVSRMFSDCWCIGGAVEQLDPSMSDPQRRPGHAVEDVVRAQCAVPCKWRR